SNGLQDNDILDYSWDFGNGTESDISSGGRYFNGFNGGHVYETPGTYTVTLTVTDKNGAAHSTSTEVVISDFSGEIYCFSNTDDFTGCPDGTQITTNYWSGITGENNDVLDYAAPNRRLLIKSGDTFTFQDNESMGEGPLHISAFGVGDKPKVQYNGTTEDSWDSGALYNNGEDFSVTDINFGLRNPDNNMPVANNQNISTGQDAAVAITLTASDADGD
ncbi:MAG: PKD domain-containing protein, partial [Desulfobacterales bacterium]|nr:PKD domain-containing protein [Desulfobacterales bacterium]